MTLGDNLRNLMFSFCMTGYLYRHVVDAIEAEGALARALPPGVLHDDVPPSRRPGTAFGLRSEPLDGYAKVRPPAHPPARRSRPLRRRSQSIAESEGRAGSE